jgi:hypothetical protein
MNLLMKYLLFISLLIVIGCNNNSSKEKVAEPVTVTSDSANTIIPDPESIPNSDSLVLATSRRVLSMMKNKEFIRLSTLFHPVSGVRFSPYGFIDTTTSKVLNAEQFLQAIATKNVIHWGSYDGSGDSILLTMAQYFNKFIYNADFLHAEKSSLNKRIGLGNSLDNIKLIFPGCNYTESHFSGFHKKYGGMDWTSLKLVFKFEGGKNYLVGIVHDQWTI